MQISKSHFFSADPTPLPSLARLRRVIGTTPQLAQKLVFYNSDLDKSTTFMPL
jgi:hypothetical protein